jgi:hypothetical protein
LWVNISFDYTTDLGFRDKFPTNLQKRLSRPHTYRLRPAYDKSGVLLLEFHLSTSNAKFVRDLTKALENINPQLVSTEEVWVNDEIMLKIRSVKGEFNLSIDIWDNAFILVDRNPACVLAIDKILSSSPYFKKDTY